MFTRRDTLVGALALGACAPTVATPDVIQCPTPHPFSCVEHSTGGRLGVAALDTQTGQWITTYRSNERFAMCSTFKWLLAAQMLYMDMHMPGFRDQQVRVSEGDLLEYAPVGRANLARGWMTVEEMCEAIVVVSDNTCANLLLGLADGPAGFTRFLRDNGDPVTRLDRLEPEINEIPPGDERDTTTPLTMVRSLQHFLLTDEVLNPTSRERLIGWMVASTTGRERLRAGLPSDWRVGDKTGTWNGPHNAANDVAIAWPPSRAPIIIACYLHASVVEPAARNAAHASVARLVSQLCCIEQRTSEE
ncbi:MAG: class A beta-lactamase [Caulobacteraceae bacterium]